MTDWEDMFRVAQRIARSSTSVRDGVKRTIAFARRRGDDYDASYWDDVEHRLPELKVDGVVAWARAGLSALRMGTAWECLILDLGDCPDSFSLFATGEYLSEKKTRATTLASSLVEAEDLMACTKEADDYRLWQREVELVDRNVRELKDKLLSWNRRRSRDDIDGPYRGDNGYLLWLMVGTLALLEPLRDPTFRRRVVGRRPRIHLLAGFEQIFFYLATVTQKTLVFEPRRTRTAARRRS
jgi:hypothetical protein